MKRTKKSKIAIALALATMPLLMGCGKGPDSNAGIGAIPGSTTGGFANGGCAAINSPITFTANGLAISGNYFRAGTVPNSQPYGNVLLGNSGIAQGGATFQNTLNREASLNINFAVTGQPAVNGMGTANAVGTLTLSPQGQQIVMSSANSYIGYQTPGFGGSVPVTQSVCISGLAIDGWVMSTTNAVGGTVYLYLNNTLHGAVIYLQ